MMKLLSRISIAMLLLAIAASACRSDERAKNNAQPQPEQTADSAGGQDKPERLIFGFTPFLPPEQLQKEFTPFIEYLSRKIGIPVELRVLGSYGELLESVNKHQVHLAHLSPLNYVRAKTALPNLILMATHIADGASAYSAYIVVRENSDIDSIRDLRGKRFGFVDRQSTSGYLYPLAYMHTLGIEPDRFFGSITFAGNHSKLIDLVMQKEIDGGATFSTAYRVAVAGKPDAQLKILAKTGRIPFDAYTASAKLHPSIVEGVRKAMLELSTRTEEGRQILSGITNINGFVEAGDDHYDEVRRVARLIDNSKDVTP